MTTSKATVRRGGKEEPLPNVHDQNQIPKPTSRGSATVTDAQASDALPKKKMRQADQGIGSMPIFWLFKLNPEQVASFNTLGASKKTLKIKFGKEAPDHLSRGDTVFFFGKYSGMGPVFLGFGTLGEILPWDGGGEFSFVAVEQLSSPIGLDRLRKEGYGTQRHFRYGGIYRIGSEKIDAISSVLQSQGYKDPFGNHPFEDVDQQSTDALPTHTDTAATVDLLGREPMAKVIAERLDLAWNRQSEDAESDPLTIHLSAPWGAGKTSFFNFLADEMRRPKNANEEDGRNQWVVVTLNAWQHQHNHPAWWDLFHEIFRQGRRQVPWCHFRFITLREWWRRFRKGKMRYILGASIAALVLAFLPTLQEHFPGPFQFLLGTTEDVAEGKKTAFQVFTGLGAIAVGLFGASRVWVDTLLGATSQHAAEYEKSGRRPRIALKDHFEALIRNMGKPVMVFIDDIDRCQAKYVVELLEGIMTLFRSNRVVFMIAGDALWIQKCFDLEYHAFTDVSRTAGRNLGHHFLAKIFQFTIPLPALSETIQKKYWNLLVKLRPQWKEKLAAADSTGIEGSADSEDDARAELSKVAEKIAEAVAVYGKEEAEGEAQHVLSILADLIEQNPRAMKRLINTFVTLEIVETARRAGEVLHEEEKYKLALISIFIQRWPILVDYLRRHPEKLDDALKSVRSKVPFKDDTQKEIELLITERGDAIRRLLDGVKNAGPGKITVRLKNSDLKEFLGLKEVGT